MKDKANEICKIRKESIYKMFPPGLHV